MQGPFKFKNEPKAMTAVVAAEAVKVLASTNPEPITANGDLYFQKVWIYPAKSVTSGVLDANTGTVYVGKSITYLPDVLLNTDGPMAIELPLGQKMKLAEIHIKGAIGDGVFYSYT